MKRVLLITQVYAPDPAAVGQYLTEVAQALAERRWAVRVLTADCGYDDPSVRFPAREVRSGVDVRRLPFSSFGKRSIAIRAFGMMSFLVQSLLRGLFTPQLAGVFVSTSPPFASAAAAVIASVRRVPLVYWVMDLNPDQAVASGAARQGSLVVRLFDAVNRWVMRRAKRIVVLDRYMAERVRRKADAAASLEVVPLWPMEQLAKPVPHAENPFRRTHGLEGRFVVMYSGNHSLVHPLDTLLTAAAQLRGDRRFRFVFIGGGVGKRKVEAAIAGGADNLASLPYQPLSEIAYSLSAADVHVVSMGEPMVGCVHPSKFYGAMALRRPILLLGPSQCHIGDVLDAYPAGWRVDHGDVDGFVALLVRLADGDGREMRAAAEAGVRAVSVAFSRNVLLPRIVHLIEEGMAAR